MDKVGHGAFLHARGAPGTARAAKLLNLKKI